jgi:hypothetical protein
MKKIIYSFCCIIFFSCSMTKNIPDDDHLFRGLKEIVYLDEQDQSEDKTRETQETTMKEEIEAALATIPNGSLFFSSYYAAPWSWRLWVYNTYASKNSKFAKWMAKSFGKPPVLMSQVNPALRASVARNVLRNNGYFRGDVTYETIPLKNPKKQKIAYTVHLDSLFTLDSVAYVNFPDTLHALIDSTRSEALIRNGEPFSVAALDAERSRVSTLFRNNGYYYYNNSYASYLADTIATANKVQLRFQLADGLPDGTLDKWYIGHLDVNFRKKAREQLTDSIKRRHLTIHFNGKSSPIRPRVILKDLRIRPRQQFSYGNYLESASKINATGVFSSTDFQFRPRPDTDTLDLTLNCVFDKPYDFYIESNVIGKTIGNYGPEMRIGFTKRNAFRGGEKLDINLHGAYEWQRNGGSDNSTYQYGADASIEFPRIIAPFYNSDRIRLDKVTGRPKPRRFYSAPTTYAKVSTDIIRRPDFYKMHIVSGEWTYRWQSSENSRHEYSPLTIKYQFKNSTTEQFDTIVAIYPYLLATMEDYFIPKMRYTYTYTSPSQLRHPIRWETTIEESGNVVSLIDMARGKSFNEKDKTLFKNPYAQFVRVETDLTKTWMLTSSTSLIAHLNAGLIWCYGNSIDPPFSEMFYVGGANSIRAFTARALGPGRFNGEGVLNKQQSYIMRNGDFKIVGNLEYRMPLFGNLHGALFLDMGNVWNRVDYAEMYDMDPNALTEEDQETWYYLQKWSDEMKFRPSKFFKDIAIGTGIGLRYDLGFLILRLDWGFALHSPYDTGNSGYFSALSFKDRHTLNFAIGYPF